MSGWYRAEGGRVFLEVKAVPGASKTEFAEIAGDRLRIRVAAAPEDGKANAALCSFLAKTLGCAKRDAELVAGERSRLKTFALPEKALDALLKKAKI